MSDNTLDRIDRLVSELAVHVCWTQWQALRATGDQRPRLVSIIDPEALVLLTLAVHDDERRLRDFVAWWARHGSRFVSLQRFRSIARFFPPSAATGAATFADLAAKAGDRRWTRAAREPGFVVRESKLQGAPTLDAPASLMLRLRAGFGVGVKADLAAVLTGTDQTGATVKRLAAATCYSSVAVRAALDDMTVARLVRESHGRPARYSFDRTRRIWGTLVGGEPAPGPDSGLEIREPRIGESVETPRWRFWAQLHGFLAHVRAWSRAAREDGDGEYFLSSRARDLYESHWKALSLNQIPSERPEDYPGDRYLAAFVETLQTVQGWVHRNL